MIELMHPNGYGGVIFGPDNEFLQVYRITSYGRKIIIYECDYSVIHTKKELYYFLGNFDRFMSQMVEMNKDKKKKEGDA